MLLKDQGQIKDAYSATATAEEYIDKRFTSAWGSVLHAAQVNAVNTVIREHGAKRVLEIAPGPGRLSTEVTGFERGFLCEFNDSMAKVAKRRIDRPGNRWRLLRGDGFKLPVRADAGLDLIYTFRFIRHFESNDRATLYGQIRGALKDGGLLVFDAVNVEVDPAARERNAVERPIYDVFYRRDELQHELETHGFTPVRYFEVIRHRALQQWLQIYLAPRSNGLARSLISGLERIPGNPLEWVVVCRKKS